MATKKLFGLMARRSGLSSQEFHDHYRHPHGTMGVHISTMRDYVQSHQMHSDLLPLKQARREAIAGLWFEKTPMISRTSARKRPWLNISTLMNGVLST